MLSIVPCANCGWPSEIGSDYCDYCQQDSWESDDDYQGRLEADRLYESGYYDPSD